MAVSTWVVATCALFLCAMPLSLLHRELSALRNYQYLLAPLLFLFVLWRGDVQALARVELDRRVVRALFASTLVWCVGLQLFRYGSFAVNGVDFSIFDWMLYNTNHRGFMYSPIYGVNHFGVHPSYVLLPLVPLHRVIESPLLLVGVSALAVWGAAFPLWRLTRRLLGGGAWPALVVVAWLTSPLAALLLDGGFRPEVLYPVLGLAWVLGWVERRPGLWIPALLAFLGIKEDAAVYVAAVGLAIVVLERERWRAGAAMIAGSVALFVLNVRVVQPWALDAHGVQQPGYLQFWGHHGGSLPEIVRSMAAARHRVIWDVVTSGWWRLLGPMLLLPLASRLPLAGMLATILLLGSAQYGQMRNFENYYPVTLVPFLFWGLLEAWGHAPRFGLSGQLRAGVFFAAVLAFPLFGKDYAKSRPLEVAKLEAVRNTGVKLASHGGIVCTQTVLFPHLPYTLSLEPLFEEACLQRPGAVALVHPEMHPYPLGRDRLQRLIETSSVEQLEEGFLILRSRAR